MRLDDEEQDNLADTESLGYAGVRWQGTVVDFYKESGDDNFFNLQRCRRRRL